MTTARVSPARRPSKGAAAKAVAAKPTRERMLDATSELLQKQGYAGTGLAQILEVSGAPRGSLYFHFPEGKEQLACEALEASGEAWKARIEAVAGEITDPGEAAAAVCKMLADELEASDWQLGCPVATVALESTTASERIRTAIAEHFRGWEAIVAERMKSAGFSPEIANVAATLAIASVEGALLLARVYRSREPIDRVSLALRAQLAAFRAISS